MGTRGGRGPITATGDEPRSIFAAAVRTTTIGLLIIITLIAFEEMAVSAALPTAARDLHGLGSFGLAFTGFLVANIVGMVASGGRCDRRGPAGPLVVGLVGFVVGLLLSGTATTMTQLVLGRVVQGLGSGLIITAVYVVIGQVYTDALRPKVFAATSSAWVVPSLVGPLVSGLLAQHASWRLVFLGLVPFTVLSAALTAPTVRSLRRRTPPHDPSIDPPADSGGALLVRALGVAIGVGALGLVADHPSTIALASTPVWLVVLLWGLRRLLPPGTGRARPGVSAPVALRGLLAGSFIGVEALVPLTLTVQHGFGATAAALPLAASGVSWAFGSYWQGRTVSDDGTERRIVLMRVGFSCVAAGVAGMAVTAMPWASGVLAYPSWLVAGLGMGLTMSSLSITLLRFTTESRRGADSAALQLSDATASALTTGAGGMLVAAAVRGTIGYTSAFVTLDIAMTAVAVLGALASGRVRPAHASQAAAPAAVAASL